MNLDLKNKKAIVCGSTQGLGFASAAELALLGADVTLVARNEKKLKEAVLKLNIDLGQQHNYIVADFQFPEHVKTSIENHLSINPIVHILVNNTGGPAAGTAMNAKPEEFIEALNSHLICNHILAIAVVPSMKKEGYGRIINIISTSVKAPIPGLAVSNTTRGAVAGWAKTLATELGSFGITVNNVLPGFTKTVRADYVINKKAADSGKTVEEAEKELVKEIPAGRMGLPEEFGSAVAFLCTPAAAYINGINLPVDGGRLQSL
ncbi:SDR family oxidoreductase [soil metagenome]